MSSSRPSSSSSSSYPGENLGLPRDGYRSVARPGRRIVGLVIDWGISYVIALLWLGLPALTRPGAGQFAVLGIFVALQIVAIPLLGGSLGHRLMGMAVTPIRGGWVGVWRPIVRSLLLGVVIPALVWDRDQRGFHDKIAGTVLVRTTR
ncbi:MAG: RDD family protein [Actinobacteria bacterium]|uniref:Unannotated protein n=1 Tax=freshwater metagenome TaxID=449393 RepID=A0A6J7GL69_9ZZZZ|nr:RDD family protein [Actinomycetota bacterium]